MNCDKSTDWGSVFAAIRTNPSSFASALRREHRTYQQAIVRVLLETIASYGTAPFDARNEHTVGMCHEVAKFLIAENFAVLDPDDTIRVPTPLI